MLTVKKIVRGILKDESLIQALNVSYLLVLAFLMLLEDSYRPSIVGRRQQWKQMV